jgi:hypothetical protein
VPPESPAPTEPITGARASELAHSLYQDLYNYDQACAALGGISRYTLSRMVRAGKLHAVKHKGRRYITHDALVDQIAAIRGEARTVA